MKLLSLIFCFMLACSFSLHALWIQGDYTGDINGVGNDDVDDAPDSIHVWDRTAIMQSTFIGHNFDWSGVGWSDDDKWATLIESDIFISANHHHPAVGTNVTFYTQPSDPLSAIPTAVSIEVVDGARVGGTDLWVGRLASAPANVAVYSIHQESGIFDYLELGDEIPNGVFEEGDRQPARLDLNPDDVTNIVFMVGKGGGSEIRVGLQTVNQVQADFEDLPGTNDVAIYQYDISDYEAVNATFTEYEAFLRSGDSGGPTFYAPDPNNSAELYLLGVHLGTGDSSGAPNLGADSFDTLPGQHLAEIQSTIDLIAVPEPREYAMGLGLVALLFAFYRRSRKTSATIE